MKKILLSLITLSLLIALAVSASAADKLEITDLKGYVDGTKDSGVSETGGEIDQVLPDSEVKVKLTLKNMYSDDDDLDIRRIEAKAVLNNIDDGDDIEITLDKFTLKPDSDKELTFLFKIPLIIDEDSYDLDIDIEGEDENDTIHEIHLTIPVEVEKEDFDLRFSELNFTENLLQCDRDTSLLLTLINVGNEEDDQDVTLKIYNARLGINVEETFVLSGNPGTDDNVFTKEYPFNFGNEVVQSTYPFEISAAVGSKRISKTVTLVFQECPDNKPAVNVTPTEPDEEHAAQDTEQDEEDAEPETAPATPVVITPPKTSFFDTDFGGLAIILVEVIVIIAGVAAIIWMLRRK